MVNGPSLGPAPVDQARANSSRLTRPNWRTWPHRKLRRKVPGVDGALTTQPSTRPVLPERSASAASMQSPPASAEATCVISLSPVLARPGASPRSRCLFTSSPRPRWWARVSGKSRPALATRRWSSKATQMRSGTPVVASKGCSFSGVGFLSRNHYPRFRGAPHSPSYQTLNPLSLRETVRRRRTPARISNPSLHSHLPLEYSDDARYYYQVRTFVRQPSDLNHLDRPVVSIGIWKEI